MEAAVAGYGRKAKVEGRGSDDAVGHVGNNVARNVRKRIGYTAVHGGDEQPRVRVSESRTKPLQSVNGKPSSFNPVKRLDEGDRRHMHVAGIAEGIFNRCPGN